MAQVKKLQTGGKLTINGKEYTINQINEYMNSGGFSSQERAALAGIVNSIANGASRNFDRNANSISGEGVTEDLAQFYGNEKKAIRNSGRSTRWANRQARRNSDHHIVNTALERFGGIEDYYDKKKEETSKTKLGRGDGWFDVDDSGRYISGPANLGREEHIRRVYDYLSGANTDFDLEGWDNKDTLNNLTLFYKSGDTAQQLIDAIKSNNLSAEQRDALRAMGYTQSDEQKEKTSTNQAKTRLKDSGYNFDGADSLLRYDDNGNLIATDTLLGKFGGDRTGNYWLNDAWANLLIEGGAKNPYGDALKGHVIIGGKVYRQDDPEVLKFMQESGYVSKNTANDFAGADSIIQSSWGNTPTHSAYISDVYSPWAHTKEGLRYRGIDGYDLGNKDHQLVEYYDNTSGRNQYGLVDNLSYAILDQYGNLVKDNINLGDYTKTGDLVGKELKLSKRLGSDAGRLQGTYLSGAQSDEGASDFMVRINPDTGITYLSDPDMKDDQQGKYVQLPKEVSDLIPENIWNYFRTNKAAKDRLLKALSDFTSSNFNLRFYSNVLLKNDFIAAGIEDPDQAGKIVDLLNEWGTNKKLEESGYSSNRIARQNRFLVDPVEVDKQFQFKTGGKIPKYQFGHLVGGENKGTKGVDKVYKLDKPAESTKQSFGLGSKDSQHWSSLDTAELTALMGDLGSLGLSFVPGANIAAASVGAAGSTANFIADIKRDGLDWKDVGSYGLNLLLAVGTTIPGAGGVAKSTKVIKAMKKAAPLLQKAIKLGAIAGVSDAVYNTIDKIVKGESFTISDVRRIVNGVSGGITLGKTGVLNKATKTVKTDAGIFTGKSGAPDIKLSKADIEAISNKPKGDQLIELQSKIVDAYRLKKPNTTKTDDQILDLYDIATKKSLDAKLKFWNSSIEEVPQFKNSEKRVQLNDSELNKIAEKRGALANWFFGTGKNQREFNQWLLSSDGRIKRTGPKERIGNTGSKYYLHPQTGQPLMFTRKVNPGFTLQPISSVVPSWQYSETEIPQTWYFPETQELDTTYVFKKGGKIVKAQPGVKFPSIQKPTLTKNLYEQQLADLQKNNGSIKPGALNVAFGSNGSINLSQPMKASSWQTHTYDALSGQKVINPNSAISTPVSLQNPADVSQNNKSTESGGSQTGESTQTGLGWKIAGKALGALGNAASAYAASKKQRDLVNQLQLYQEQHAPEHSFRYRDPGIDLAYNKAINQQQSVARNFNSTDQSLNAAVGLQTADKTAQMELERGMKKAQLFDEQRTQHENLLQQEALNRTGVVNRNAERARAMDAMKLQQQSAYIAQNQGIAQGLISDLTGIGNQITAGKRMLKQFDAKNTYLDQMNKWRTEFDNSKDVTTGLNNGLDFDQWLNATHKNDYENLQRNWIKSQFKKGGKVRSVEEQIQIDNNKIRAKAIDRLSKQAFELLKMALS